MMATTTTSGDLRLTGTAREQGAISRLMQRLMAARQRQVDAMISAHLLRLDDRTLAELGYERKSLQANSQGATYAGL